MGTTLNEGVSVLREVWSAGVSDGSHPHGPFGPDPGELEGDAAKIIAALGFSWEDVRELRGYADTHGGVTGEAEVFASIADRIAALLPPE